MCRLVGFNFANMASRKAAGYRDSWMSCSQNRAPPPRAPNGPPTAAVKAPQPPPPPHGSNTNKISFKRNFSQPVADASPGRMNCSEGPCTLQRLTVNPRAWPLNKPRTKKMNFPKRFIATTEILGASKRVEHVEFIYHRSGQNRDTFVALNRPWLLQGMALSRTTKKCANQPVTNQCLDEWQRYQGSHTLRPYLPVIFGYCEVTPEDVPVACLLMERVAFTWDDFKVRLHREPLREENLLKAVVAQCQIVTFFNEVAQTGIPLINAHSGNLCFVDDSLASVRLIDWHGNDQETKETFYKIMKRSIEVFCEFSPGVHTHDHGAGQRELCEETPDVQTNILRWREFLHKVSTRVNEWFQEICQPWNLGSEMRQVPVEALERLRRELGKLAVAASAKTPSRARASAPSGAQTSSPSSIDTAHGQISDDEASEKVEESDEEMSSEVPNWEQTPSPSYLLASSSAFVWGAAADRSLSLAASLQLDWMRNNAISHSRPTKFSKTLAQQIEEGDFLQHGGSRPVGNDHLHGDCLGLLLGLVLQHLAEEEYLDRCEGPVPKAATDPKKLHDRLYIYWVTNFADWDSLTEPGINSG